MERFKSLQGSKCLWPDTETPALRYLHAIWTWIAPPISRLWMGVMQRRSNTSAAGSYLQSVCDPQSSGFLSTHVTCPPATLGAIIWTGTWMCFCGIRREVPWVCETLAIAAGWLIVSWNFLIFQVFRVWQQLPLNKAIQRWKGSWKSSFIHRIHPIVQVPRIAQALLPKKGIESFLPLVL